METMDTIKATLEKAMIQIEGGYTIDRESDFQSIFFGELYKALPNAIIRLEKILLKDHQSYVEIGRTKGKRRSRVDIHVVHEKKTSVVELKFIKGAGKAVHADMLADIAKVERIIESGEADDGFCVQLIKPGVEKRLALGPVAVGLHQPKISGWNYNFKIKGQYQVGPLIESGKHAAILHHIK